MLITNFYVLLLMGKNYEIRIEGDIHSKEINRYAYISRTGKRNLEGSDLLRFLGKELQEAFPKEIEFSYLNSGFFEKNLWSGIESIINLYKHNSKSTRELITVLKMIDTLNKK